MGPEGLLRQEGRRSWPVPVQWLARLGLGYACLVGLMSALESVLVFPAPRIASDVLGRAAAEMGAKEVRLQAEDGTDLYGWRVGETDRLILYFSGNGSSVGEGDMYSALLRAGWSTLHINYRGYPGSSGSPSEAGLGLDAQAAWLEARSSHPADRIVVMGKSLGGGVAVGLVAGLENEQPGGLVLESTFSSAVAVGAEAYPWLPVRLLMRNRFDSLAVADRIRCSTLILHGGADEMIGPHHAKALAEAIVGARLLEVSGLGHNDRILTHMYAWEAFTTMVP